LVCGEPWARSRAGERGKAPSAPSVGPRRWCCAVSPSAGWARCLPLSRGRSPSWGWQPVRGGVPRLFAFARARRPWALGAMGGGSGQALLRGSASPSSWVVTSRFSTRFSPFCVAMGLRKQRKKLVVGRDCEDSARFKEGGGTWVSVGFSISVRVGFAGAAFPSGCHQKLLWACSVPLLQAELWTQRVERVTRRRGGKVEGAKLCGCSLQTAASPGPSCSGCSCPGPREPKYFVYKCLRCFFFMKITC